MIEIEIDIGNGPRKVVIDPKKITLGFLEDMEEAQRDGGWKPLINAITSLIHFTRDESRMLTVEHLSAITDALRRAVNAETAIPNG